MDRADTIARRSRVAASLDRITIQRNACTEIRGAAATIRVAGPGATMSDPAPQEEPQETFLSHLVELRTRLLRAIIAVVVVLLCLFPFAKDIYALLAAPLL